MFSIEYLRSFKIFSFALFDLSTAFLGILLLSPLLTRLFRLLKLEISTISWLLLTLPIGLLTHLLIGQNTPMTKDLLDPGSHYFLKIFIGAILFLGIKSIKRIKP